MYIVQLKIVKYFLFSINFANIRLKTQKLGRLAFNFFQQFYFIMSK